MLFGEEFIAGSDVLYILLLAQVTNTLAGSLTFILQMTGHEKILQYFLFVSLFINVMLNFCLIPKIGITGAAIFSFKFILCTA